MSFLRYRQRRSKVVEIPSMTNSTDSPGIASGEFRYPVRAALRGLNLAILLRYSGNTDEGRSLHRGLECAPCQDLPSTRRHNENVVGLQR